MAALHPEDLVISDDLLTCKHCLKTFDQPKLLPCHHSFCKKCLIQNVSSEFTVACPCCETIVKVTNGDIEQLPDNYLFSILQEQRAAPTNGSEYCLPCQFDNKNTIAAYKCLDCQDTFCEDCKKFHKFTTQTRNHSVVDIKKIQGGKYQNEIKLKKNKICEKHSNKENKMPLDLYCEDCQVLVCKCGITLEHRGHFCSLVDAVEEKERIQLKATVKQLDDIRDKESKISDHLDDTWQSLKKERDEAENKVHQAADELYALVDKVKDDKLKKIKTHYESELEKVKIAKQKQEKLKKHSKTMKLFADAFLTHSSKVDFVSHFKDVEFRVKDIVARKEDTYVTTRHIDIENKPCTDAIENIDRVLGKISIQVKTLFESGIEIKEIGETQLLFDVESKNVIIRGLTVTDDNDIITVGGSNIGVYSNDGVHKRWISCQELKSADDVTVSGKNVCISDKAENKRKILVIDLAGVLQRNIRMPENEQKSCSYLGHEFTLAVDTSGTIYIASQITHTVYKCTSNSTTLQPFLTKSKIPGLHKPRSLCITPKEELVVCNADNFQVYKRNSELLWHYEGGNEISVFKNPRGVCCDKEGKVYCCVEDYDNLQWIHVVSGGLFIGKVQLQGLGHVYSLSVNWNYELIILNKRSLFGAPRMTKIAFWK